MNSELENYTDLTKNLYNQAVAIIEQARSNIVYSVNHNTVLANWLLGRIIIEEIQSGNERADYGKQVLEGLSIKLNTRYGGGFSIANLKNFRQFYLTFADRIDTIRYPADSELSVNSFLVGQPIFSSRLTWSHYRAIMRVKDKNARDFYEKEAAECGWDKRDLERQIQTQYYERILSSQNPQALVEAGRKEVNNHP